MTIPADVLEVATREIGYTEDPAESNFNKFGDWYGANSVPWCAIFVSYCFFTAQLPLPITTDEGFAYCPDGVDWFKGKGWWIEDVTDAEVGDVVFFHWDNDYIADHIGIVESINSDGSIDSIEGNTAVGNDSNGGEVMRRNRDKSVILGFGRPSYTNTPIGAVQLDWPKWPGRYITLTTPFTKGDDVLTWQKRMIEREWDLGSGGSTGKGDTGVFNEACFDILKKFQKEKALEVDGKIGPVSWRSAWEKPVTA